MVIHTCVTGYGLKCHRIVTEICKLVGIKDMRCKVLGSTNPMNVVQAAFKALGSQVLHFRKLFWVVSILLLYAIVGDTTDAC